MSWKINNIQCKDKVLMSNDSTIQEFYEQIYNLSHIQRYSTVPRIKNESVAEHSFFVAALVVRLHKDYQFDIGRAVSMAILHDWTESWIDDITVPTKRKFEEIELAISKAEIEVAHEEFPEPILSLWLEHKDGLSIESKIVHLADVMQCIQYAKGEVTLGNKYMERVLNDSESRLISLIGEVNVYRR
jgi:5'-deoxynucleotidase YfbR-like HD superfamily hydrolase